MKLTTNMQTSQSITIAVAVSLGILVASTANAACASQAPGSAFASSRLLSPALYARAMPQSSSLPQPASRADEEASPSIVGLWSVNLFVGNTQQIYDQGFDQFHSGGTEVLNDNGGPPSLGNVCLGVWKQIGPRTVKLRHLAWNWDDKGNLTGTFLLLETITLEPSGNSFAGTYVVDNFDLFGNVIPSLHAEGALAATRIDVDTSSADGAPF